MAYDFTKLNTSIRISGVDLRKEFGFEVSSLGPRNSAAFERREYDAPNNDGVLSSGGKYGTGQITVRGWIDKANIPALLRFLSPYISGAARRTLQFGDHTESYFLFDAVTDFTETPLNRKRWRVSNESEVSFTIDIVEAFGRGLNTFGVGMVDFVYSKTLDGASVTSPGFVHLSPHGSNEKAFRGIRNAVIKIGACPNGGKFCSAPQGPMTAFKRGLKVRGVRADLIDAEMWGPIEIPTNPDFEGGTDTGWTATNATKTVQGVVEFGLSEVHALPWGNYVLRVNPTVSGGGVSITVNKTSGKDYVVCVEYLAELGHALTLKVDDNTFGDNHITQTLPGSGPGSGGAWQVYEAVFRAQTSGTVTIAINGNSSAKVFFLKRATLIEAESIYGGFDQFTGSDPDGWTKTNVTTAAETADVHSAGVGTGGYARKALKMSATSVNGGVQVDTGLVLADNTVYQVIFYAKTTETTDQDLTAAAASGDVPCFNRGQVTDAGYTRFSTFCNTHFTSPNTLDLAFTMPSTNKEIILDDIAVIKLEKKTTGIMFEPGPLGPRLQVKPGNAVFWEDAMAVAALSTIFHGRFNYDTERNSPMFWQANTGRSRTVAVHWNVNATAFRLLVHNGPSVGVAWSETTSVRTFDGRGRGTLGVGVRYDGLGIHSSNYDFRIFTESIGATGNLNDVEKSTASMSFADFLSRSLKYFIMGDGCSLDGFWTYNYGLSDAEMKAECHAMSVPASVNRQLVLNAGDTNLLIDSGENTLVKVAGDGTISSGWPNTGGDFPDLSIGYPVLFCDQAIKGLQVQGVPIL